MPKQTFYIISDPQVGNSTQERYMQEKKINVLNDVQPDDVIILPGDLTNHGRSSIKNPLIKYLCVCYGIRKSQGENVDNWEDQLDTLKKEYINPLENACKNVFMCIGNHDSLTQWWIGYNPVFNYIRQKHGSQVYAKEVNGIMIYCLSEYPKKSSVDWLEKQLKKNQNKASVIFFHYNIKGPYSDWWSDTEKDYFAMKIDPFKKHIAFIAEGHLHTSYVSNWNGIVNVNGAGNKAIKINVDTDAQGNINEVLSQHI